MSLYGALNTAVSGIGAQAAAFTNISDNVANSQTVGFKRVDTSFTDYLTTSTPTQNTSGAVVATPKYINNIQGTISQTDNPLAMAIAGQGFFPVSESNGTTSSGAPTFDTQQYYTRSGDFTLNNQGYMVNSAGAFLNGWTVDTTTGVTDETSLAPIQISQTAFAPIPTSNVVLSANLPATPSSTTTTSSQIEVYDSLGTQHTVNLNWSQIANGDWTVTVNVPDDTSGATDDNLGTAEVQFGPTVSGQSGIAAGTIGNIVNTTGEVSTSGYSATGAATITVPMSFTAGTQDVTIQLASAYGAASGVTQYAGTDYDLRSISQDGVAAGAFSSVTTTDTGDIVLNYDNGESKTVAQVPIATFNSPDQLTRQNGQSFTSNNLSGTALLSPASLNGAGNIVTSSVEGSNVDIATEFTQLIVAQQAYSANAKVVTTANQLLTTTIDLKQ